MTLIPHHQLCVTFILDSSEMKEQPDASRRNVNYCRSYSYGVVYNTRNLFSSNNSTSPNLTTHRQIFFRNIFIFSSSSSSSSSSSCSCSCSCFCSSSSSSFSPSHHHLSSFLLPSFPPPPVTLPSSLPTTTCHPSFFPPPHHHLSPFLLPSPPPPVTLPSSLPATTCHPSFFPPHHHLLPLFYLSLTDCLLLERMPTTHTL